MGVKGREATNFVTKMAHKFTSQNTDPGVFANVKTLRVLVSYYIDKFELEKYQCSHKPIAAHLQAGGG